MVSIIIPTYNYGHYIAETLDAVFKQSFTNWECIIVDDGSTDQTRIEVEKWIQKDKRFSYIFQENKGVSAARNKGIEAAKGEFIQFLDGDDLLQIDKLKSQIACFELFPESAIVYGEVRYFTDHNKDDLRFSLNGDKAQDWMPKIEAKGISVVQLFAKSNFMVIHAPLVRISVFKQIGDFNAKMKALEDWDFWMRCALADFSFHFTTVQNDFALVRAHQGSLSTQKRHMTAGHFIFLQNCLNHPNLSFKYRTILLIKYLELFWDNIFKKSESKSHSTSLTLFSCLLLPFYLLIKIIRFVK